MGNLKFKLALDAEIAADFREGFSDHYDIISHCVMELEKNPDNVEFLDEIFRSLHTIKGNANMCQFDELTQFAHTLEDVVSSLRDNNLRFTHVIGEIILLTLDKIKEVSEDLFADNKIDYTLVEKIEASLENLKTATQDEVTQHAKDVISLITGHIIDSEELSVATSDVITPESPAKSQKAPDIVTDVPPELNDDLHYFCHLASLLESKLPYWNGRIKRTLPLAKSINEAIGSPVDQHQLEAALYMHDIAFAFLSESFVMADSKYTEEEKEQMRVHPRLASDLVRLIPGWEEATKIIAQHHEKWDGTGYPKGLRGNDICKGAQIMAIVDAYESMTHPRPDRQHKRSVLRAVTEINNCSGSQFSPDITIIFNQIIKDMMSKSKK